MAAVVFLPGTRSELWAEETATAANATMQDGGKMIIQTTISQGKIPEEMTLDGNIENATEYAMHAGVFKIDFSEKDAYGYHVEMQGSVQVDGNQSPSYQFKVAEDKKSAVLTFYELQPGDKRGFHIGLRIIPYEVENQEVITKRFPVSFTAQVDEAAQWTNSIQGKIELSYECIPPVPETEQVPDQYTIMVEVQDISDEKVPKADLVQPLQGGMTDGTERVYSDTRTIEGVFPGNDKNSDWMLLTLLALFVLAADLFWWWMYKQLKRNTLEKERTFKRPK